MSYDLKNDPLGAFCRDNPAALKGSGSGPLAGLTFAAKDVFDIAGHRTGFGNPTWLATHPPATQTAEAVTAMLSAGADLIGRTISDEITYSLTGENAHYGTPLNPRAPDRVPGGSSSGSATAVAGGAVDVSLGTDCGGSVRLPASYCGIFGMRPTHGRISLAGAAPFAPSFDTVGWFARDASLLDRVGRVLLADRAPPPPIRRLLVARDALALVASAVADALRPSMALAAKAVGQVEEVTVSADGLPAWMEVFRTIQAGEIWANHGAWVREAKPNFGPGIRERFDWAATVEPAAIAQARQRRAAIAAHLDRLIGEGDVLCLPASPRAAPPKNSSTSDVEVTYRFQAMSLLCIAGLGGLPQLSMPLAEIDGCPLGLSFVGRRNADTQVLDLATRVSGS